jgi:D-glycero-D-manno-heptose 1,7-bisphosphate phosphatase
VSIEQPAPSPVRPSDPPLRPGVFLDRDGTIIGDPGYLRHPEHVELFPGAGAAIARLNAADRPVIVVTNQSGISRGKVSEQEYRDVAARLGDLLAPFGARIDATYVCPHAPERDGPCACRKPGLELFQRAAADHRLDLAATWWVGDRLSDLLPAASLGGKGVLVETGEGPSHRAASLAKGFLVASGLGTAVDRILAA